VDFIRQSGVTTESDECLARSRQRRPGHGSDQKQSVLTVLWVSQQLNHVIEDVVIRHRRYCRRKPCFRTETAAIFVSLKLIDQDLPTTSRLGDGERTCNTFAYSIRIGQLKVPRQDRYRLRVRIRRVYQVPN
jgi:hypothetical protein